MEHAFGIFAKRWRLFLGTIEAWYSFHLKISSAFILILYYSPEQARLFTLAAVILHNFLRPLNNNDDDEDIRFPTDRRLLVDQRAPEAGRLGRLIRENFVDVIIRGAMDE